MSTNDWQNKLRAGLEDYAEPAPDHLWAAVSAGVSGNWKRARRRRIYAAGASFAAISAVALILLFLPAGGVRKAPAGGYLAEYSVPVIDASGDSRLHAVPVREARPLAASAWNASTSAGSDIAPDRGVAVSDHDAAVAPVPVESVDSAFPADSAGSSASPDTPSGTGAAMVPVPDDAAGSAFDAFLPQERGKASSRGRVSMKLTASNLGASASVDKGYGGMFGSGVASLVSAPFVPNDAYSAVLLKNNFREISTSKRHYQPIRVGLAAAWDFSGRFSLESGLTYSYLVSDLSSGTASDRYDIRQTLHYVGVPLDLNFSIWKASGFDLYLSAGVLAEKCVGGNTATSYFLDSKLSEKISEGISEKPWQWSAGASVGVRYDFNKYIGLYAEPGLSYYFDDGSFIESVYSDRPLNFTLSLGLRFSFGR